jgi:ammonia channel protein AmtB
MQMIGTILIGVAAFAAQLIAYRVVSKKLAQRRQYKERLAGIRTVEHKPRPAPMRFHNRPGEN